MLSGIVQYKSAPREKWMFLDFEHDIQIPGRSAVRPRLAFAGNAQARAGIHTGRNAQLDSFFALHAPLPAAFQAALLHNLSSALASGASARDGEKSLLVRKLPATGACLASLNTGAFFRPGAVARFAEFLARKLDLGGDASGSFLEGKRHVVAQIRSALCAIAPTAGAAASE